MQQHTISLKKIVSAFLCSHFLLVLAGHFHHSPNFVFLLLPMPMLKEGKIVASSAGQPASSAQADSAQASSAQADKAETSQGILLLHDQDAEYKKDFQSSVRDRISSFVPRAMPDMVIQKDHIPYVKMDASNERPFTKLPETNLETLLPPPGMDYNDDYVWRLAKLFEGKEACVDSLPTWQTNDTHFMISKIPWLGHTPLARSLKEQGQLDLCRLVAQQQPS